MCGMQLKWYFGGIYRLKCLYGKEKLLITETENKWEFTFRYYKKTNNNKNNRRQSRKSRMWEIIKIEAEIDKIENKVNDVLLRNIYITFYTFIICYLSLTT